VRKCNELAPCGVPLLSTISVRGPAEVDAAVDVDAEDILKDLVAVAGTVTLAAGVDKGGDGAGLAEDVTDADILVMPCRSSSSSSSLEDSSLILDAFAGDGAGDRREYGVSTPESTQLLHPESSSSDDDVLGNDWLSGALATCCKGAGAGAGAERWGSMTLGETEREDGLDDSGEDNLESALTGGDVTFETAPLADCGSLALRALGGTCALVRLTEEGLRGYCSVLGDASAGGTTTPKRCADGRLEEPLGRERGSGAGLVARWTGRTTAGEGRVGFPSMSPL